MQLGYYGLGKMGANMVWRLVEKGNDIVASNRSKEPINAIAGSGAATAYSLSEMVLTLKAPRTVWVMVPSAAVQEVVDQLLPLLQKGDVIIDGGNTFFEDTVRRAKEITGRGIGFVDVGVSGGPGGARDGACLMVGGSKELYDQYEPLFRDAAAPDAYGYMGPSGAGHFVKMVHNGIEYGMMQAIAEGFTVLKRSDFNLDLLQVSHIYSHQSVVASRLVGWLADAYKEHGVDLQDISGTVNHSGEGEWTIETAKKMGIEVSNIEQSLEFRKRSQQEPSYTGQVLSALRGQFGGHDVEKTTDV